MVYFKIIEGDFKTKETIRNVINYVLNPAKNPHNIFHAYGNTKKEIERMADSFLVVQQIYNKTSCKRIIHCILSFSKEERHSPKQYLRYGYKFMEFFGPGTQYIFALHEKDKFENSCYPHIHFVINPINSITGKRLSIDKKMLYSLHEHTNRIFEGNVDFKNFPEQFV